MVPLLHRKFGVGVISVTMELPAHGMDGSRLRIKIRTQYEHCTGGVWPQILSAFVKQGTYQPLDT
jgi:hypothetical protein